MFWFGLALSFGKFVISSAVFGTIMVRHVHLLINRGYVLDFCLFL